MASGATAALARGPSSYLIEPEKLIVRGVDTPESDVNPIQLERLRKPLNEATVISMVYVGVQKTVFARRNGERFEVWDGNRRVLHAREANRRLRAEGKEPIKVRFEIRAVSDNELFALSRLNNRHQLDESPLQTAEAAAIMMQRGKSEEEVAAYLGLGVPMLRIYLALNDLHPDVRDAITAGVTLSNGMHATLAPTAAAKLARLSREEQVKALEEMLAKNDVTVAGAAAVRSNIRSAAKGTKKEREIAPAPPKRVLTKLVEAKEELSIPGVEDLDFFAGIEFALGRLPSNRIKGMNATLSKLTSKKQRAKEA